MSVPESVSIGVSGRVRKLLPGESAKSCVRTEGNAIGIRNMQSRAISNCNFESELMDFFPFNNVFAEEASNEAVFAALCRPLCDNLLRGEGFNSLLMAYGTTGSGKPYTLLGDGRTDRGVLQIMVNYLKASAQCKALSLSGVEVYGLNENKIHFFDLFDAKTSCLTDWSRKQAMSLRREDVDAEGKWSLKRVPASEAAIGGAMAHLHTAETSKNKRSSRGHSVFILNVRTASADDDKRDRLNHILVLDLAGSEVISA